MADSDAQGEVHARTSCTLTGGVTCLVLVSDAGLRAAGTLGADTIRGGGDTLQGSAGDTPTGGEGADLFVSAVMAAATSWPIPTRPGAMPSPSRAPA